MTDTPGVAGEASTTEEDDPEWIEYASPAARLWARLLDTWLLAGLSAAAIGLLFPMLFKAPLFEGSGGDLFLSVFVLPFALAADALILALFGSTLGKALVGIRVETLDGRPLSAIAFARSARIYVQGFWLGFPLLNLVGMAKAKDRLVNKGATAWDEAVGARVIERGASKLRTVAVALLAIGLHIGAFVFVKYVEYKKPEWERADIVDALPAMNEGLPHFMDDVTRMDRVAYTPEENVLSFEYTLIHRDASIVRSDELANPAQTRAALINQYCGPAMKPFRDRQIPVRYRYRFADGSIVQDLLFTTRDCAVKPAVAVTDRQP